MTRDRRPGAEGPATRQLRSGAERPAPRELRSGAERPAPRELRSGEAKLADAARRLLRSRPPAVSKDTPKPYDHTWGWWVEQRLGRLEAQMAWLIRLALATLAGEVIRIVIGTLNLPTP